MRERDPEREDLYRQLMTYDLYARENLKNRPVWAKDQREYKEVVRRFYQREAEERRYLPEYQSYDEKQISKMTHLEIMDYHPDTREPGRYAVLFDYRERDALTYEARGIQVEIGNAEIDEALERIKE